MNIVQYCCKTAWEVVAEPFLTAICVYEAPDRSYGRSNIPFSPMEKRLHENKEVTVCFRKVVLQNGKDWVWYQVWEDNTGQVQRKGDIIFAHGTGVHSGTLASHSRRYLKAGFRLLVPDLVSHGYSSGVHVYQRKMSGYTEGLHAVLMDVAGHDDKDRGVKWTKWDRLPTFMLGLSFGGTVALHYALDYPHSLRQDDDGSEEVAIDGIIAVGPILGYSPDSIAVPVAAIQILRFLDEKVRIGRLELVVPHKKALDKDPNVYKSLISEDKRSHQGAFRIGHLAMIEDAIIRLHKDARSVRHPIFLQQGGQDRVACHKRSMGWIRKTSSLNKRMAVYPVCQHVIYRKAKTEEEDFAGRLACIEDNVEWMSSRVDELRAYTSTDGISYFFEQERWNTSRISISDRTASWSSTDTDMTANSSLFSESENTTSGISSAPEMTEVSPPLSPDFSSGNKFSQLQYEQYDCSKPLTHPLLTKAHKSTLPTLARLAPLRAYRSKWSMSEELRPYDILVSQASEEDEEVVYTGFSMPTKTKRGTKLQI